jgi:hypothetical protein
MSIVIKPPPPTVPFGWLENGTPVRIDQAWDLFLRALVERTGGVDAPTNSELAIALHDDAGIEEMRSDLFRLAGEVAIAPSREPQSEVQAPDALVQALIAQVAEMRKEIDALKAGTVL